MLEKWVFVYFYQVNIHKNNDWHNRRMKNDILTCEQTSMFHIVLGRSDYFLIYRNLNL